MMLLSCKGREPSQDELQASKVEMQQSVVVQYAAEGFLMWARATMTKECPGSLAEIAEFLDRRDTEDLWGNELQWFCGANLPAGAKGGFAVQSAGPDGKHGTGDDIRSWR